MTCTGGAQRLGGQGRLPGGGGGPGPARGTGKATLPNGLGNKRWGPTGPRAGPGAKAGERIRLPGGRGRLALRSGAPEPPARAPRGEARRGGERERRRPLPRIPGSGGGGGGTGGERGRGPDASGSFYLECSALCALHSVSSEASGCDAGCREGITQVTFTGNQFAESLETAVLGVEEKFSPQEVVHLDQRSVARPSKPSPDAFLASPGKDAAAQRQAQEGDVQGQEGAEAGHAGGPTADHHGGAAHTGRGRASDRGIRVCGHAPHRHRVSAVGGLPKQGVEAREGESQRNMAFVSQDFPDAELRAGAPCLLWSLT
ncbi:single-pass membrane and coiled-coil domain-containing protein 4 [Panthera onca]